MPPCRPGSILRAVLFTALSLLIACPCAVHASSPRQVSEARPAARIIKKPGRIERFGSNFLAFLKCREANVRLRRELLAYGPEFPRNYDPSDFSFRALVNTNWPMTVEYELEQQSTVVITIKVMGAADFTQRLDGEGMGKLRTARFILPVYSHKPDAGPHPALISFKAIRPGTYGDMRADFRLVGAGAGPEDAASRRREPIGVEVAGLGPLPHGVGRNVGSPAGRQFERRLGLSDVKFSLGANGYDYSFKTSGRFNRWGADITRKVRHADNWVTKLALYEEPLDPGDLREGVWNGRAGRGRVRPGKYSVRVRVWVLMDGKWEMEESSDPLAIG